MFLIRSRVEYREHLERLKVMCRSERLTLTRKQDLRHQDGIYYGLDLALQGLADWEKQQPTSNKEELKREKER